MIKISDLHITCPDKPWRGGRVEIDVPGHNIPLRIDVLPKTEMMRDKDCKDEIMSYTVNWAALGSVSAEMAEAYSLAIKRAVSHAKRLTKKYRGTDYT